MKHALKSLVTVVVVACVCDVTSAHGSVGLYIGGPVYVNPPPIYRPYYPPGVYQGYPPAVVYGAPPVIYGPPPAYYYRYGYGYRGGWGRPYWRGNGYGYGGRPGWQHNHRYRRH
jgi:hypothetical protein